MRRNPSDLVLIFSEEQRPRCSDLARLAEEIDDFAITAQMSEDRSFTDGEPDALELHQSGLTFECCGFGDRPPQSLPNVGQWIGFGGDSPDGPLDGLSLSLGPHLRGGQGSLPILKGLLQTASLLGSHLSGCLGVVWSASSIGIDRQSFTDRIEQLSDHGSLPMQMLVRFKASADGALTSAGLDYFALSELAIEERLSRDQEQATLLGYRIAEHLIRRGALPTPEQFIAPDGQTFTLAPKPEGGMTNVLLR